MIARPVEAPMLLFKQYPLRSTEREPATKWRHSICLAWLYLRSSPRLQIGLVNSIQTVWISMFYKDDVMRFIIVSFKVVWKMQNFAKNINFTLQPHRIQEQRVTLWIHKMHVVMQYRRITKRTQNWSTRISIYLAIRYLVDRFHEVSNLRDWVLNHHITFDRHRERSAAETIKMTP